MGLNQVKRLSGRKVYYPSSSYLYFGGTAYLGIPFHPVFKKFLKKGMALLGTNYGSSRKSNIHLEVYDQAEISLSQWLGYERALSFSSGYLAAQAVLSTLEKQGYKSLPFYAEHPALFLNTLENLNDPSSTQVLTEEETIQQINSSPDLTYCLLSASVNPLLAKIHNFQGLEKVKRDVVWLLDDSHGLGILGKKGRGIGEFLPKNSHLKIILVSSLGKALGVPGGVILGSKNGLKPIESDPIFMASSPIPPAYLYAYIHTQKLYSIQKKLLEEKMLFFKEVSSTWSHYSAVYPVLCLNHIPDFFNHKPHRTPSSLIHYLMKKGILISSFAYPRPEDKPITRLVFNACHTYNDLKRLSNQIENWLVQH